MSRLAQLIQQSDFRLYFEHSMSLMLNHGSISHSGGEMNHSSSRSATWPKNDNLKSVLPDQMRILPQDMLRPGLLEEVEKSCSLHSCLDLY